MSKIFLLYILLGDCVFIFVTSQIRNTRLQQLMQDPQRSILPLVNKRIQKLRTVEICYETVGCFEIPRHHNPLQQFPEHPEFIDTQFYLFRRNINFSTPEVLKYSDGLQSLQNSKFNPAQPVKIIIHGYMTRWNEVGALAGAKAYLDIEDCNAVLVNWERGARGPRYGTAAANTEMVGRQLGLLLLDMASIGVDMNKVHLVGFSLGAHVAACAAQQLKDRGLLLGRITGLDPASPLFKANHFRDKRKKLDVTDAKFVDVVHTDGSPIFTDGFGLLEPLGHVDYFPNGGREQPGCTDIKGSVLISHLEKTLDREIACSHIRAYRLFLESLLQKVAKKTKKDESLCEFIAYSCPKGPKDFAQGRCFPADDISSDTRLERKFRIDLGTLGEDSVGRGPMYLVTRAQPPFCGTQLQATVSLLQTKRATGVLYINVKHENHTTEFQMALDVDSGTPNLEMYGLAAAEFGTITENTPELIANLYYSLLQKPDAETSSKKVIPVVKITVKDLFGNSWQHCGKITIPADAYTRVKLKKQKC